MPPWAALGLAKVAGLSDRRPSWIPDLVVLEMSNYYWSISSLHAHEQLWRGQRRRGRV